MANDTEKKALPAALAAKSGLQNKKSEILRSKAKTRHIQAARATRNMNMAKTRHIKLTTNVLQERNKAKTRHIQAAHATRETREAAHATHTEPHFFQ